ncbi:MAG TPA: PAS domain S-box protein [Gemmatimonadaceae bacterium]|nr:PAS domain S-box protein [Gemmatimonadaceae bacterium]
MSDRFVLPLRSKIAAGLITAVLVLIVGAISFWAVSRAARSFDEVNHTSRVLLEQQRLLAGLADAETAARGYALTGDSAFLPPYRTARVEVPAHIERLRGLTADTPVQQNRLDTLESVGLELLRMNDQIIRIRNTSGEELAKQLIASGQSRLVMDHARALTDAMERLDARQLSERAARRERDVHIAYLVIGLGGGLAFLLSLLINWSIRRDVIERERQRELIEKQTRQLKGQAEKLAAQQATLEQQLKEQQALAEELSASNDHLQAANFATVEEKARAESALLEAEKAQRAQMRLARQMSALLESTAAGFYGMDLEGLCTFINRAGATLLGFQVEELIGREMHAAVHHHRLDGRDYPVEECPIFEAARRGASAASDNEVFWRKDGTPLHVEFSSSPIIEDGEHRGDVVAFADIGERLRAQRAVAESEARKAAVLRSTLDSIVAMDRNGNITEFNPAAESAFGYKREEVLGRRLADLIVPHRYREAHLAGLRRFIETGEAHVLGKRLELPAMRRDGSEFQSELTITRSDSDGMPAFTGVLRDITDRKKAEAEREQLIKALARSNQELDQFAYVASHDLKAPLRGIANLSQWIEEDLGDRLGGENKSQMEMLRGRVQRMESLIDGILQYSRAGRAKARPESIDTGALVRDVIDLMSPPQGITIETLPGMPTVRAERVPLQQVFMNLLGNAIKHAGKTSPLIQVGWAEAGPFYEFTVRDNGPGIAPQYHERIFGIFQTLEARDKIEGTGIGLSVVQKIVEARGGKVWVESEVGKGAKFKFLWPKVEIVGA